MISCINKPDKRAKKCSRTLHGCVDWNILKDLNLYEVSVCRTLHGCVDWNNRPIEITEGNKLSHPSWVRGLKYSWPCSLEIRIQVAPFMGAWIEINDIRNRISQKKCRTLHGCVDWNYSLLFYLSMLSRRTLHGCVDWNNDAISYFWIYNRSHPSWVRGLK